MYEVTMPKLSDSMEVGRLVSWSAKEGDEVHEGETLAEVESDKAVMQLECFRDGTLLKIVHGDDSEVPIGEIIAFIGEKGEEVGIEAAATPSEQPEPPPPEAKVPPPKETEPAKPAPKVTAPPRTGRVAISPYARRLAQEEGIDYSRLQGTGPGGRIIARDIGAASPRAEAEAAPLDAEAFADRLALALAQKYGINVGGVPGSGAGGRVTVDDVEAAHHQDPELVRPSPDEELPPLEVSEDEAEIEEAPFRLRTQARRVTASKHVIPHFYVTVAADVTALLQRRETLKAKCGATVTQLVMLGCLKALEQHPDVNRSYDHGRIINWKGVNLGLAVQTDAGLTVAVLKNAQELSLAELVQRSSALVERTRAGKLSAEERRHPTFTISNLGMYGVEHFEPIINPPSAVTLGVSSALPTAVVRNDALHAAQVMKLTASCDHRIMEGVGAAEFLRDLKALLEDPDRLLAED